MKLSLAIISKEPSSDLERCLNSVIDYVDEVVIGIHPDNIGKWEVDNKKIKVYPQPKESLVPLTKDDISFIKEFGIDVPKDYKVFRFDIAKNDIFSKATGEWILWLDSDDIVDHPELIKETVKKLNPEIKGVSVNYAYRLDNYGRSLADHWRTRLVKRDSDFVWKGAIHEDLLSDSSAPMAQTYEWEVKHLSVKENESVVRNIIALLKEFKDTKDQPDPRILYYLGMTLFDAGRTDEGVSVLRDYIKVSGWDEQIYDAYCWIGRKLNSSDEFFKAIDLIPEYPMAYLHLADLYLDTQPEKSIQWYEIGLKKPYPKTALLVNPRSLDAIPLFNLARALEKVGRIKESYAAVTQALKFYPNDSDLLEMSKDLESQLEGIEYQKSLVNVSKYLKKHTPELLKLLPPIIPYELEGTKAMSQLRKKIIGPKKWASDTITIFCPSSWEKWDPTSLETGIGGSEEAIIRLSREFVKLGYQVVVYGTPKTRGNFDGVVYLNSHEFNYDDDFNHLIVWRAPYIYQKQFKAKTKWLWLHDVHSKDEFTPEILKNLDRVIVLSKYHRSLFPNIPEEKIMYSANGLTIDYKLYSGVKKNPYKMIYTSCPSRGLEHLLNWWPDIKKVMPKAELHVYYGFDNFIKGNKDKPEKMKWMSGMQEKLKQDGIIFHGRKGQDEINKATAESTYWVYPLIFPEISCITAMKMQALGVLPLTTGYAALEETQQYGLKEPDIKELKQKTLDILLQGNKVYNEKMVDWARKEFSWRKIATEWEKCFKHPGSK